MELKETRKETMGNKLMEMREETKLIIIRDEDSNYDPLAAIMVNESISLDQVQSEVLMVKESLPGKWQLSDVMDAFTFDYVELPISSIYI